MYPTHIQAIARSAIDLIGNTPVIEIPGIPDRPGIRIFGKLEGLNPGGSIKDRPGARMIVQAVETGSLRRGLHVVEVSSGNAGTAIALTCAVLGYPFTAVVPRTVSLRKVEDMRRFGAEVRIIDEADTTEVCRKIVHEIVSEDSRYWTPDQFSNPANADAHYVGTGAEILAQLPDVTHAFAAIGSGGTCAGVSRRLKEARPECRVFGVASASGNLGGMEPIEEIRIRKPLLRSANLDSVLIVEEGEARQALMLGYRLGLQLGISSAGVLAAALRTAKDLSSGTLACVMADAGWKYPDHRFYRTDHAASNQQDGGRSLW